MIKESRELLRKQNYVLIMFSQDDLASAAHVSLSTVRDFEKGRHVPIVNNLAAMRVALEARGIVFVDGGGTCGITYARPKKGEAH